MGANEIMTAALHLAYNPPCARWQPAYCASLRLHHASHGPEPAWLPTHSGRLTYPSGFNPSRPSND